MSVDMRRVSVNNGTQIGGFPLASANPTNGQTYIFNADSGYWEFKSITTANAANQIITGPVILDGLTRIGANGTPLTRLRTFVGPNTQFVIGQNIPGTFVATPAFSAASTWQMTLNDESTGIRNAALQMRNPTASLSMFDYVVRNLAFNTPLSTTAHVTALAVQ